MVADATARGKASASVHGHPQLVWFNEVRALFAASGLPPEPETYELFYLHVPGADAALSRDLDCLLLKGS